jgi:hypothetical protein
VSRSWKTIRSFGTPLASCELECSVSKPLPSFETFAGVSHTADPCSLDIWRGALWMIYALKGPEADLTKLAPIAAQKLACAIETCYNWTYFRVVSTLDLPPVQGESLWAAVPRVGTMGFIHNLPVGSPPRPIFLRPAFTDPRPSSLHPSTAQRCDGTQAGSLCYATLTSWRRHSRCTAIASRMALGDRSTARNANDKGLVKPGELDG